MALAAIIVACMPEPHILLSVVASTLKGRPAFNAACRAGAWPWPAGRTLPIKIQSTSVPAIPASAIAAFTATAPNSLALKLLNSPNRPPIGVRAKPTITTGSCIGCFLFNGVATSGLFRISTQGRHVTPIGDQGFPPAEALEARRTHARTTKPTCLEALLFGFVELAG